MTRQAPTPSTSMNTPTTPPTGPTLTRTVRVTMTGQSARSTTTTSMGTRTIRSTMITSTRTHTCTEPSTTPGTDRFAHSASPGLTIAFAVRGSRRGGDDGQV